MPLLIVRSTVTLATFLVLVACRPPVDEGATVPVASLATSTAGGTDPTPLLVVGGVVFDHPGADAVLMQEGRIRAVGGAAALSADPATAAMVAAARRIDASGGLVLPGLADAHIHMMSGGVALGQLDLEGASTLAAVTAALATWAAGHPELAAIEGRGWSYDLVPRGSFPNRTVLDAVVGDRPVVLEAYDGHTLWLNSAALARAGISAATPNPEGGHLAREADGRTPAGTLHENAMALAAAAVPEMSEAARRAALGRALEHCLALGITSVDDITDDPRRFDDYASLAAAGRLPIRVQVSLPLGGDLATYAALRRRFDSEWLRFGGLKGFLDGVVEAKTAYLLTPYERPAAAAGVTLPPTRGAPLIAPERLSTLVNTAHRAGLRVELHAIGDAAVRLALDTYERSEQGERAERPTDASVRDRIEHIEVIDRADLRRFAALGVIASMQPYHANPMGDSPDSGAWSENLGAERRRRSFAWRELEQAGATLAFGSDWPVMSADPLAGIAVAVTRRDAQGRPAAGWNAHETLTPEGAIRAYTVGAALAMQRADLGTLAVDRLADLVVLSPSVRLDEPRTLWTGERIAYVIVGGVVRWPHTAP